MNRLYLFSRKVIGRSLFKATLAPYSSRLASVGLMLGLLGAGFQAAGQVSGKVFKDFNANGVRDSSATFVEVGARGILVTASDGSTTATAVTNDRGDYVFPNSGPTAAGKQVRLIFSGFLPGDFPGPHGSGNASAVQFVTAGSTYHTPGGQTANFGLSYPSQYCQDNPLVATSCFVSGKPQPGSEIGQREVLVSLNFDAAGNAPHFNLAKAEELGAVMGLAYMRRENKLFSAAFTKRHVGFGPGGPGAIYVTQLTGQGESAASSSVFFNFGATAGNDPHDPDLPTSSANLASRDNGAFDAVGKMGLGDIDLSDDEKTLYVVNLFNRRLYALNTTSKDTVGYSIPNPGCPGGSYRPFAVKYYRGAVYVGVVCSQEGATSKTDTAGMNATVYKFVGGTFTSVLSFPLTYKKQPTSSEQTGVERGEYWRPWSATYQTDRELEPNGGPVSYSQAWLTDIEFDVNGDMILGIRDRFGDQMGYKNYKPFVAGTELFSAISPGEILRAGRCTDAEVWTIENNGAVCGETPSASQTAQQGPGGGKYYFGDVVGTNTNHGLSSMGTLAMYAGSGRVIMTSISPTDKLGTGGVKRLVNKDGSKDGGGNDAGGAVLYSAGDFSYGKANGLGDIELLCAPAPLEIGNRVWADINGNGIQDAGEPGLSGVTVALCLASSPSTPLATATTDANGNYYFSSGAGTSTSSSIYGVAIPANTAFILKFPTEHMGKALTLAKTGGNDLLDSDANAEGKVSFTTGLAGENNQTYDVGYKGCADPGIGLINVVAATCNGSTANPDASFTVSSITGADRYTYATTPAGLSGYSSATALSGAAFTISGLANPSASGGQAYYIRLFNAGESCVRDTLVVVPRIECNKQYDLALSKSVSTKLAALGDTVTYTLKVWNEGEGTVHGIEVTDSLNAGVHYLSSVSTQGIFHPDTHLWTIDSLAVGDTISLAIKVKVIAQGVWFNTAEITKMNEKDVDSTPGNGQPGEDDMDKECFTVPVILCSGQGSNVVLSVPEQYGGVVWFRKEQGGEPVQVGTGNTYTASETLLGSYEYSFTSTSGSCPAEGCCPVIVVVQDCCPVDVCVPFVITKKMK